MKKVMLYYPNCMIKGYMNDQGEFAYLDGTLIEMPRQPDRVIVEPDGELPDVEFVPKIQEKIGVLKFPERVIDFVRDIGKLELPELVLEFIKKIEDLPKKEIIFDTVVGELEKKKIVFDRILNVLNEEKEIELVKLLNELPEQKKIEFVDVVTGQVEDQFEEVDVDEDALTELYEMFQNGMLTAAKAQEVINKDNLSENNSLSENEK